jgi:hypothetical protein
MNKSDRATSAGLGSVSWVSRFLVGYLILIGAQAFLASLILSIPFARLVIPVFLLFLPAAISGPMIYQSRKDGGLKLGIFITAIVVHFVSFALAIEYTAYILGYLPLHMAKEMIPFVFITAALASASLYINLRHKSSTHQAK